MRVGDDLKIGRKNGLGAFSGEKQHFARFREAFSVQRENPADRDLVGSHRLHDWRRFGNRIRGFRPVVDEWFDPQAGCNRGDPHPADRGVVAFRTGLKNGAGFVNRKARKPIGVLQRPAILDEADDRFLGSCRHAPFFNQNDSLCDRLQLTAVLDAIKRRLVADAPLAMIDFEDRGGHANRRAARADHNQGGARPSPQIRWRRDFELMI